MKTKIILALTFFLFAGMTSAIAVSPAAESINSKFKETIIYPEQAVKAGITGYVDVTFILSDEGEIVIKKIVSSDPVLAKLVKEQLKNIKCEGIDCTYNEHFKVRFDFKQV